MNNGQRIIYAEILITRREMALRSSKSPYYLDPNAHAGR